MEKKDKRRLDNVIEFLKEQFRRYYGVRESGISDLFRFVDGAYEGKLKPATPEERKQVQEILGMSDEDFETIWCFWDEERLLAKNNREYWSSLAGRLWIIDLEKKKASVLMMS